MTRSVPPIPDDVREAAMDLARMRYRRDDAGASVMLGDSYDARHPDGGEENLDRYFEEEWAPRRIAAAWGELHGLAGTGDALTLWRNVCIDGDPLRGFLDHYDDKGWVGIFWATDRDAAHPHNSEPGGPPGYLFEATAEAGAVDWIATLASYAHPDWVGEEEIRLLPDAEVTLVSMHKREGWLRRTADDPCVEVDLGEWVGKRFKAGDPDMACGAEADADGSVPSPAP